jgi:hypothetical protein
MMCRYEGAVVFKTPHIVSGEWLLHCAQEGYTQGCEALFSIVPTAADASTTAATATAGAAASSEADAAMQEQQLQQLCDVDAEKQPLAVVTSAAATAVANATPDAAAAATPATAGQSTTDDEDSSTQFSQIGSLGTTLQAMIDQRSSTAQQRPRVTRRIPLLPPASSTTAAGSGGSSSADAAAAAAGYTMSKISRAELEGSGCSDSAAKRRRYGGAGSSSSLVSSYATLQSCDAAAAGDYGGYYPESQFVDFAEDDCDANMARARLFQHAAAAAATAASTTAANVADGSGEHCDADDDM